MGIVRANADGERSERLRNLYTGVVADILDELGYRNQCLPGTSGPWSGR